MATAIVDCGMGNLYSVAAAVRRCGAEAEVTSSAAKIAAADKVIFPGDGHFAACISELERRELRAAIAAAAREKPFFGICVGMQVLFSASEESDLPGLGIFPQTVRRIPAAPGRKVPHMGWNTAGAAGAGHFGADSSRAGAAATADSEWFYFIHSYYAPVFEKTILAAEYGVPFSAAVADGGLLAAQFHPEKSGAAGEKMLRRFLAR